MSNGEGGSATGGGGDAGGGGAESGPGVIDSPSWFAGVEGSVGLGVDGFNSMASGDSGPGESGSLSSGDMDAAADESSEGWGGLEGGEGEDTSTTEGQESEGSGMEGISGSEGGEGQENEVSNAEGASGFEGGDRGGAKEGSDSRNNTHNIGSTAESDPGGAPPESKKMRENDAGGSGPTHGDYKRKDENSKSNLENASRKLDAQQERIKNKYNESAKDSQKAQEKKRDKKQEQPSGDDTGQLGKNSLSAEQTSQKALFEHGEGQDIQDNSPVRRPNSGRRNGTISGGPLEDTWKQKLGGSYVSGDDFLPKGGGSRLSDGKSPGEEPDKIGMPITGVEAVVAWNSESVKRYKERLLKDPGAGGELARKYHRLEHPGAVG